jgi:hypothetical protein
VRILLRNGPHEVQLLGREEFVSLLKPAGVRALLQEFAADDESRASLRHALAARGLLGTGAPTEEDPIGAFTEGLLRGQAVIVLGPNVYGRTGPDLGIPPTPPGEVTPREAEQAAREGRAEPVVEEKTWLEIELVDEVGNPVPGEQYAVELPGGAIRMGRLDENGRARIEGLDPGACNVSFPNLDARSWKFVKKA